MKHQLMFVSLAALALGACGGTETRTANTADNMTVTDGGTVFGNTQDNMVVQPAPMTGQQFADAAAASDIFEVESAKLAQSKGTAPAIKEFAAMMIKDHTASTAKLKAAAAKADPAITPMPMFNPEQDANLKALKAASGTEFDTLYKQQQIDAHQKALTMLQGYAANGDAASLKTFASETAPVVEGHLKHVNGM